MAQQIINVGSAPNDGTGDVLRNSQIKANANFTELYANKANASDVLSNDETTYTAATLPLAGTEEMILNDGSGWKKITWTNIKTQLKTYFDTVYQAILVSGTNIKTINGTSILGSGDLVVSGGGGNVTLIHKNTTSGTNVVNTVNGTPRYGYGVLIPANTVQVGDFITIEASLEKVSGGSATLEIIFYYNNVNSLSGATIIASSNSITNASYNKNRRTIVVKSSTNTEILYQGSASPTEWNSAANTGNRSIDWTTDKYLIVAIFNNGALDYTSRVSTVLITKI